MLNTDDDEERDRLTEKWKDNKLQELNFIGIVVSLNRILTAFKSS